MPLTPAALFRLVVTLALALHVFWMYALARTMNDNVGFHPGITVVAALFALVMTVPLVWAVALLELPDMLGWFRGQRRWKSGRCPGCGYPADRPGGERCPECATELAEPPPYRFTIAAVRRFLLTVITAWIIGTVSSESWLINDEHQFRYEVQQMGRDGEHSRRRRWPVGESHLFYDPELGFHGGER